MSCCSGVFFLLVNYILLSKQFTSQRPPPKLYGMWEKRGCSPLERWHILRVGTLPLERWCHSIPLLLSKWQVLECGERWQPSPSHLEALLSHVVRPPSPSGAPPSLELASSLAINKASSPIAKLVGASEGLLL
jgi:hypothetical protein